MAYAEVYAVDCSGLKDGYSRTYEFTTTPLPGQPTDQHALIDAAKDNLSNEGFATPPYEGVTFRVRLLRTGEI